MEYDAQGIHRDKTLDWKNCIVIGLNGAIDQDVREDPDWPEYWDMCLEVRYIPRNTSISIGTSLLIFNTLQCHKRFIDVHYL